MGTTKVSVEIGKSIEITVGKQTINLNATSVSARNYVAADALFSLNGLGSTTGFKYNSTTGNIEFYIDDELVHSMAPNDEENPFA